MAFFWFLIFGDMLINIFILGVIFGTGLWFWPWIFLYIYRIFLIFLQHIITSGVWCDIFLIKNLTIITYSVLDLTAFNLWCFIVCSLQVNCIFYVRFGWEIDLNMWLISDSIKVNLVVELISGLIYVYFEPLLLLSENSLVHELIVFLL